ncbi:hypothetical protein P7C73_g5507, partial [Tremellales sp. Uapishka_1]
MIHRRPPAAPSSSSSAPAAVNSTHTPLRRPSARLYATPQSGIKAQYDLPSPTPSYSLGSPSLYANRSFEEDISYESEPFTGDWKERVRKALDKLRKGFGDSTRLDRSWGLVWG